jgi:hypothetical protein
VTLLDLVFILLFLTAVVVLVSCLVSVMRGQRERAARRLRMLGVAALVYMVIVCGVSLLTPRAVLAVGEDQCSDDWCIAVQEATHLGDSAIAVTFRVASRALRVTQRERFVVAYMRDGAGRRYDASPAPDQPGFDVELGPGAAVSTRRVFRVPRGTSGLGVIITREGDIPFPRCCIIGTGLLHKDPIVPVP